MVFPTVPGFSGGSLFPTRNPLTPTERAAFATVASRLALSPQKRQTINDVFTTHLVELGERSAAELAVRSAFDSFGEQQFFSLLNFYVQNPIFLSLGTLPFG